jgi:hypothetical protein
MAMQSKGERHEFKARVPVDVDMEALSRRYGCSSVSQYLADLACIHAGRPDLVRELNQEMMPISA